MGQSALEDTIAYIGRQPEHHQKRTFEQEFRGLMKLYQLEFDERYLWETEQFTLRPYRAEND